MAEGRERPGGGWIGGIQGQGCRRDGRRRPAPGWILTKYVGYASYTPVPLSLFADRARMSEGFGSLITSDTDTLVPVIRWDTTPRRRASQDLPAATLPVDAQSLRYDLRLYDAEGNERARADALSIAHYQVPEPLEPCTLYRWTVRSSFTLAGRDRVTDWSGGYNGLEPWNVNYPLPRIFGDRDSPKLMPDRKLFYFRFRTPDADGGRCSWYRGQSTISSCHRNKCALDLPRFFCACYEVG